MPALFPEMWVTRVALLLSFTDTALWLDGIPELDTEIIEVGSGSASEQNLIYIPLENFDVEVLLNNTTYPLGTQDFTDGEATVKLDKWETKVTNLTDDQTMGASYKRIDNVTRPHTRALLENKFTKAIHALAPAIAATATPIIKTTGALVGGRRLFRYEDLVALRRACDLAGMSKADRRVVLTSDHYNDLLLDRDRFANQLNNIATGEVAPKIAGFKIYQYDANPYFHSEAGTLTKTAYGVITTPGIDFQGSVVFDGGNVAKKNGLTKQYFSPSASTPTNPVNQLNYRHYFMTLPIRQKFMGAIIDAAS